MHHSLIKENLYRNYEIYMYVYNNAVLQHKS